MLIKIIEWESTRYRIIGIRVYTLGKTMKETFGMCIVIEDADINVFAGFTLDVQVALTIIGRE